MDLELVKKFKNIFTGLERAHGVFEKSNEPQQGKKVEARMKTVHEPPTLDKFELHLKGEYPAMGIVPINDDNECVFGAIDIDVYPLDHKALLKKIANKKFPLITCLSKSGGAHLYLFTQQKVSAKEIQLKLSEMSTALGYPSAEVFPKQIELFTKEGEEKRDTGSWINMPYHGRNRYALKEDGRALSLEEFFDLYEKIVVSDLKKIKTDFTNEIIKDGPPCLQILTDDGVGEGGRNNALFNIGVYYRKFDPDNYKNLIEDYNRQYIQPPLKSDEVLVVIKQVSQSDSDGAPRYSYRCTQPPIESLCNKRLCKKRKYGVGGENDRENPVYSDLKVYKSDPPRYFLNVDDRRIEISSTEDLMTHKKVIQACIEQLNKGIPNMAMNEWNKSYTELLENISIDYPPEEVTKKGEFRELLEEFILHQGEAITIEDIFLGKSFTEDGFTYFALKDLMDHLKRNDFKESRSWVTVRLREEYKAEDLTKRIKKVKVRLWKIEEILSDDIELDIPDMKRIDDKEDEIPF
tara:strand:- start:72 stop:1631 length:1560 start_codon:yes stop_codon:yes gene_type:complete